MKLSIAQRLYLGLTAGYVIVIAVGILTYLFYQKQIREGEWVRHTQAVLQTSTLLKQQVTKLEATRRSALVTTDAAFFTVFETTKADISNTLSHLQSLVHDNPKQFVHAQQIELATKEIVDFWTQLAHYEYPDSDGMRRAIRTGAELMAKFDSTLTAFDALENSYLAERDEMNRRSIEQTISMLLGGLVLILVIVTILSYQVYHELVGRVRTQRQLKQNLKEMETLIAETSLQNWKLNALSTFNDLLQLTYYGDVEELADACAKAVAGIIDVPSVLVYHHSEQENVLALIGKFAPPSTRANNQAIGMGITGQAARSKEISVITDLPEDAFVLQTGLGSIHPKALALVPLWADEQLIGLLELASLTGFAPEQLQLLELLAHNLASALKRVAGRKQLEQLVSQISEQKEELIAAQEVLTDQASALAQSSRYKSEFLANMSHELRTPLNSILILANLLADDQDDRLTEKQREYSRIIHKSGSDLLNLINDILDLSKIEAGKIDLLPENMTVTSLLGDMEDLFRAVSSDRRVRFEVINQVSQEQVIYTDKKRAEQILKNLLSNALKFTPSGGEVLLTVRPGDTSGQLLFAVKDTGPGIADEYQSTIFEAFKQVDGATNRKYGGTGLGLSISKRLAEQLGGALSLVSTLGVGSEFTFRLPVSGPSVPLPEPTVTHRKHADAVPSGGIALARQQRIIPDDRQLITSADKVLLIVEDDENFATILRDFARRKNYLAIVALTGEEGLYCARKFKPSAILLDIHLPGLSGTEILATLKRTPELANIPVHIITSHDDLGYLSDEISGITIKPFEIDELDAIFAKLGSPRGVALGANPVTPQVLKKMVSPQNAAIVPAEDAENAAPIRLENAKILLADDDMRNVFALTAMLETHGAQVVAATDGADALEQLEANPDIQLILMDIMMPVMDGYETMRKIRENAYWNHIPMLAISAKAMAGDREKAIDAGASDYITKPVDPQNLLALSKKWLTQV